MRLSSAFSVLLSISAVFAKSHDAPEAMNQISKIPFTACIDDGDCNVLGADHACFQYICYPWKDDSSIPENHRKQTCKKNDDCSKPGETCFRHHNRRNVNKGICVKDSKSCEDGGHNDCNERRCCAGRYCCEEEYFKLLKDLPCTSDFSCNDLGLGNYCCPTGNGTAPVCCNTNPNPPPTTPEPKPQDLKTNAASSVVASVILVIVCAVLGRKPLVPQALVH